jgi:glycosyltransferase involved in cell wall biosynthesis
LIVGKKEGFITGDKEIFEIIERDLELRKRVVFTGYVSDMELNNLYENATVFVFPSYYEGFGLPPLEAMSKGVAVAASKSASLPEVCGNGAIYFDPFNVDDIKDKILFLLENEEIRNKYIVLGKEQVRKYSLERCYKEHKRIFEEVM